MIQITDPTKCCGCTARENICSHNAIIMQPDAMGFYYPIVDRDKCINCGLCEKICAFNDKYDVSLNLTNPEAYAVRHRDMHEVETSRSGAAFIAISNWIINHRGSVYGVGYGSHFHVMHKRAITKEQRNEFKGSKYVQSDMSGIFKQVKNDLRAGIPVLFSGTPCQTSGLNSYIGKKLRNNLYLVDIICHGVPSPYIWEDYLNYLEKKQNSEISSANFRDKQMFGWKSHKETFIFNNNNGEKVTPKYFTFSFYQHIIFRHSCEKCCFCNIRRPSDITLGDFWGWEKTDPEINRDDKGVSLVLCNTEKGQKLFEAAKHELDVIPAKIENCMQPNLSHPSGIHPLRNRFEKAYLQKGFEYAMKKYGYMGGWQAYRFRVVSFLLRGIRFIYRALYHFLLRNVHHHSIS